MATGIARPLARSCRPAFQSSPSPQRGVYSLISRPQLSTRQAQVPHRRWLSSTQVLQSQPASRFSFNVAASYIAKDRPYDPSKHVFHFNPYNRVQPPKKKSKSSRPESGQDAFFVSRLGDTGSVALGVADGVGGWMDSGVDPADFSHSFCDYMAACAYENKAGPGADGEPSPPPVQPLTARELMQKGYEAVCHDPAIEAGGSTAIVGVLEPEGTLEVANLGDSGFIHLRLNAVHGYSEPQTHAFNTPFQLSVVPPSILRRMAAFGGTQLSDLPRDAEVSRHRLRHGDVLVFASDGVWDNLFNQDILRLVSSVMRRGGAWVNGSAGIGVAPDLRAQTSTTEGAADGSEKGVQTLQSMLATEITFAAKAASVNTKLDGPFAKEVKKYYPNETWRGGKVDDICVIAVVVSETKPDAPVKAKL